MDARTFRQIREAMHLTTAQLAETLMVSQRHVQKMEAGTATITKRTERDLRELFEAQNNAERVTA